jgi:glycosyltransferase involved in cell wall biosynthesis
MKLLLPKVIVDCERMKYPFTGLYEYCKNLCNALILEAENGQLLSFYVRESEFGFLGEGFQYVKQKSLHKFVLPPTKKFDVWHATYQGTMYFPYSRKIKVVLTVHDINFMHEADRSVSKKQKELKKLQDKIDRSDFIVAISHFVLDDLKKNLNLEGKRTVVIYNGCTIDQNWTPTQDSKFVQYDYEYIFTIGTIIDKKNFHVIPTLLVGNELHLIIAGIVQSQAYYAEIILEAKKMVWKIGFTSLAQSQMRLKTGIIKIARHLSLPH